MEVKLIEVRDRGTFIPAIAIKLTHRDELERFLLRRAGYAEELIAPQSAAGVEPYVLFSKLDGGRIEYDPYSWGNRTMQTAHQCAIDSWDNIKSGDVLDVEYVLHESDKPKTSERFS